MGLLQNFLASSRQFFNFRILSWILKKIKINTFLENFLKFWCLIKKKLRNIHRSNIFVGFEPTTVKIFHNTCNSKHLIAVQIIIQKIPKKPEFFNKSLELSKGTSTYYVTRFFNFFRPPFPLVTKNHTNPYVLTMVRNKSQRALRNLWTSPKGSSKNDTM
jgi:hypothetical protein